MCSKNDKVDVRRNERNEPIIVISNSVKKLCHTLVEETNEDGDVFTVKMRPTQPFLDALNRKALDLLEESIVSARANNRTTVMIDDVPDYDPEIYEDDEDDLD